MLDISSLFFFLCDVPLKRPMLVICKDFLKIEMYWSALWLRPKGLMLRYSELHIGDTR